MSLVKTPFLFLLFFLSFKYHLFLDASTYISLVIENSHQNKSYLQATQKSLIRSNLIGQLTMVIWSGCPYYREWRTEQSSHLTFETTKGACCDKIKSSSLPYFFNFFFFISNSYLASTIITDSCKLFQKCQNFHLPLVLLNRLICQLYFNNM